MQNSSKSKTKSPTQKTPKKRLQNKDGLSFVKDINDLKDLLAKGYYEFRIALGGTAGGLFSRKWIYYDGIIKKGFSITNCIDDTEQRLTEKQLMNKKCTNIGEALKKNCLIVNLKEKI